jgi:hypothetical protein
VAHAHRLGDGKAAEQAGWRDHAGHVAEDLRPGDHQHDQADRDARQHQAHQAHEPAARPACHRGLQGGWQP